MNSGGGEMVPEIFARRAIPGAYSQGPRGRV
jgi:hypothetical protein